MATLMLPSTAQRSDGPAGTEASTSGVRNTISDGDLVIVYEGASSMRAVYVDAKARYDSRFGSFIQKASTLVHFHAVDVKLVDMAIITSEEMAQCFLHHSYVLQFGRRSCRTGLARTLAAKSQPKAEIEWDGYICSDRAQSSGHRYCYVHRQ